MLIVLSDVLVACISAACSQIATCSWCGLQPYRGTALRHCGVQPGMAKHWFKLSAGGLDGAAKTLDELEMVEVPPEHPPAGLRAFFEQAGYTVRHKLSRAELAACGQSTQVQWVTVQAEAMENFTDVIATCCWRRARC